MMLLVFDKTCLLTKITFDTITSTALYVANSIFLIKYFLYLNNYEIQLENICQYVILLHTDIIPI